MAEKTSVPTRIVGALGTALLTSLLLPIAVAVLISVKGPELQEALSSPDCDNPRGLHAVTTGVSVATAKNRITDGTHEFGPQNLIDGDSRTAWIEGQDKGARGDPNGLGIGAHIDVTFDHPVDLQMICLQNGWTISEPTFVRNGRVRLLKVRTESGTTVDGIPDKSADHFTAYQRIALDSGSTKTVRLTIESVNAPYALEADRVTSEDDTAISEIEFWTR